MLVTFLPLSIVHKKSLQKAFEKYMFLKYREIRMRETVWFRKKKSHSPFWFGLNFFFPRETQHDFSLVATDGDFRPGSFEIIVSFLLSFFFENHALQTFWEIVEVLDIHILNEWSKDGWSYESIFNKRRQSCRASEGENEEHVLRRTENGKGTENAESGGEKITDFKEETKEKIKFS